MTTGLIAFSLLMTVIAVVCAAYATYWIRRSDKTYRELMRDLDEWKYEQMRRDRVDVLAEFDQAARVQE